MITTSVQQASQMLEIQGVPSTVTGDGDEFRVAFVASVSGPPAQTAAQSTGDRSSGAGASLAGISSNKQALAGAILAKSASIARSPVSQSSLSPKGADPNDVAPEVATASDSASSTKSTSDLALKNSGAADDVAGASITDLDSRLNPITGTSDESHVNSPRSASTIAPIPSAASKTAESAAVQKGDGLSKPLDSGFVARGRKNEASTSSNDPGLKGAQATVAGTAFAEVMPTTAVVPAGHEATLDTSVAVQAQQADDVTKKASGSPIRPVETGELISMRQKPNEVASLQRGPLEFSGAITDAKVTEDLTPIANCDNPLSGATGSIARSASKSASIMAAASQSIGEDTSARPKTLEGLVATAAAATDATVRPLSRATLTQSPSGFNKQAVKTNVSATGPASTTASQARAIAAPHSGLIAQPLGASQSISSKVVGTAQGSPEDFEDKVSGRGKQLTSTSEAPAIGVQAVSQVGANIPHQVEVLHDATPVAGSLRAESLKIAASAAKDDKARTSPGISEDSSGIPPTAVLAAFGDTSSGSPSNLSALVGNTAGRVITAADVATPMSQATPHIMDTSAHGVAGDAVSAVAARGQGTVSAGTLTESTSAGALVAESHRTLLATPTALEVGVQSGTQGWLRIRAEVGDQGAVNASLSAVSSGGRELLHSQLPALNAFLHSEQIAITPTVVERGTFSGSGQGATLPGSSGLTGQDGSGASHGSLPQGAGAQSDGDRRDSSRQAVSLSASETGRSYDAHNGMSGIEGSASVRTTTSGESGRWLNVRV